MVQDRETTQKCGFFNIPLALPRAFNLKNPHFLIISLNRMKTSDETIRWF